MPRASTSFVLLHSFGALNAMRCAPSLHEAEVDSAEGVVDGAADDVVVVAAEETDLEVDENDTIGMKTRTKMEATQKEENANKSVSFATSLVIMRENVGIETK